MKRRSDRGEWGKLDGVGFTLLVGLFALVSCALIVRMGQIARDLQRIADAVCVYAPPAEQSAANPLVGRVAVLRGYGAGRYTVARITGVCTRPVTGLATPFVEYSAYFIEAAECRSGSGGCTLRLFRENLIGFVDGGRHGLELVGIEQSAVPAEEVPADGD